MWLMKIMKIFKCCSELEELKNRYLKETSEMRKEIKKLNETITKLTKQINFLLQHNNIFTYDLKLNEIITTVKEVDVFPSGIWDIRVADKSYYGISYNEWREILNRLWNVLNKFVYTKEVFDCDNFAFLSNAIIMYNCYKYKLKKQLAFGIAWSNSHAFNIFVTIDKKFYIYEPQNNKIIGKLRDGKGIYRVKKIMFLV